MLVLGGLRVIEGHLSLGMLVAFQSLMQSFLAPVTNLVGFASTLQDLQGALHRLDDVLHHLALPARVQTPGPAPRITATWHGNVQVRNLTFGYSRVSPPTLDNISVTLQPGQRVALMGPSGSGKSTLARLVCGLYEPWQGEVLFDGVPRAQIPPQMLSQAIAMVDQDLVLFAGSVRENLTLWGSTVPDAHLIQACKDAALHEVILALPGGYDGTLLEGAANLSGGQRQRLELARALVHDPVLLVLDEATSALDAVTESQIMERLRQRDCACLIVAHRLSTLCDCEEILVLEQGTVVQRGTHTALRRQGVYARLRRDADAGGAGASGAGVARHDMQAVTVGRRCNQAITRSNNFVFFPRCHSQCPPDKRPTKSFLVYYLSLYHVLQTFVWPDVSGRKY
jgi:ATP-binding cassette, subfamily C, bacterial